LLKIAAKLACRWMLGEGAAAAASRSESADLQDTVLRDLVPFLLPGVTDVAAVKFGHGPGLPSGPLSDMKAIERDVLAAILTGIISTRWPISWDDIDGMNSQ